MEGFEKCRWIIAAMGTVLLAVVIALVGCARSMTTPQPVSTISGGDDSKATTVSIPSMKETESGESAADMCGNDYILLQESAINSSLILSSVIILFI